MKLVLFLTTFLFAFSLVAKENCTSSNKKSTCTDKILKEKVKWACDLIEKKGKGAIPAIKKMRYDCCGEPDYVWINTFDYKDGKPNPVMVMHPIKPMLNGKNLAKNKDPNGKFLFNAFVDAVKASPKGTFVDYQWTKFGQKDPSDKKSWVMKCKVGSTNEYWIPGSGTWK